MYQFAVIALLALATVKLVDFIVDFLPSDDRGVMRSLLTFVVAIGGVWALDFSMFAGWGIDMRNENLALGRDRAGRGRPHVGMARHLPLPDS